MRTKDSTRGLAAKLRPACLTRTLPCLPGKLCLVVSALAILCSSAVRSTAAQTYTITDLGTLGGTNSYTRGINNVGQVVGSSTTASNTGDAFLWTPSKPNAPTGTLTRMWAGAATAINASGQVLGPEERTPGRRASLTSGIWTPSRPNGTQGSIIWLRAPTNYVGQVVTAAGGVNDAGTVVGVVRVSLGDGGVWAFPSRWVNGQWSRVSHSDYGFATAINDAEQIVGGLYGSQVLPTLWQTNGTATPLNLSHGWATAINSSGQVVVVSGYDYTYNTSYAFLWTPTTPNGNNGNIADLGSLGGTNSYAYGINASGQIVGYSATTSSSFHAFVWLPTNRNGTNGSMTDLNTLIPPGSGWELTYASAINDEGQIAGRGVRPRGQTHAFLLTPPPAPRLTSSSLRPNSQFDFTLTGEAGRRYTIQASTNLVTWTALTNFVSAIGTNQFTDPAAPFFGRRFYRAVTP